MKTNKMLRIASVLLVAVMISTCAISGTFAKYVKADTGSDSARVAKFGVEITANGSTFAGEYATNDPSVVGTIAKSVITSGDMKNLVAPGTTGNMVAMTLTGIPEVAVNVKYEATLTLEGWKDELSNEYCPIYFTIKGKTYGIKDQTAATLDNEYTAITDLVDAVEAAIGAYSANYAPHTDLSVESVVDTPDVSWTWDFSSSPENDVKDTYLGDQAAKGMAYTSTITLTVTTTVTQID